MSSTNPQPTTMLITSYSHALRLGNPLLILPREIRDEIYKLAIETDEEYAVTEPNKGGSISVPGICLTSHQMRSETLPIFIACTEWRLERIKNVFPITLQQYIEWCNTNDTRICKGRNAVADYTTVITQARGVVEWISNALPDQQGFQYVKKLNLDSLAPYWKDDCQYLDEEDRTIFLRNPPGQIFLSKCKNLAHITWTFRTASGSSNVPPCTTHALDFLTQNSLSPILTLPNIESMHFILGYSRTRDVDIHGNMAPFFFNPRDDELDIILILNNFTPLARRVWMEIYNYGMRKVGVQSWLVLDPAR